MASTMVVCLMVLQVLVGLFTTAIAAPATDMDTPVTAAGKYPEIILGPGMPTLESINLTSADLYTQAKELYRPQWVLDRLQAQGKWPRFTSTIHYLYHPEQRPLTRITGEVAQTSVN